MKTCKLKFYYYALMPLLCLFLVFTTFTMPTNASTTSGNETGEAFEYTEDYVRDNFDAICRYVTKWYAIVSDSVIGTWQDFEDWLDSSGNGDVWTQHPHSPIRIQNGVENVEVPTPVLQVVLNYMQERIQNTDLGYTECYLPSYNFVDPTPFVNASQFYSFKEWCSQQTGYICVLKQSGYANMQGTTYIWVLPRIDRLDFVGTTSYGSFSSVSFYYNWSQLSTYYYKSYISGAKLYGMNQNGQITENPSFNLNVTALKNSPTITNNYVAVYTSNQKNELVYVFKTLNALKNYNSGYPQQYYLTSDGLSNSNWTVGSGTINTGTLSNANSTYSSVVNNVQSGWTADEVLELVNMISNNASNGNGSGNGSGSDDDGWLDLGIFGDIGKAIAKVIGAIITAIASIFEEIIGIVTQVSETLLQGVIFEFLSAFIGWLPDEIIALLTALFSVAVLFALVKLIREAF